MSSAPEEHQGGFEAKSSVKISRTAKGDASFEVKVYQGTSADDLAEITSLAQATFDSLNDAYHGAAA